MEILLAAINSKYIHSNLAVRYLKEYTVDMDYKCKVKEFSINDRIEKVFENIITENPDIVAFSCYIWNIEYVKKLANLIKTLNSKIEILYGGPEVSYDAEKFLLHNSGDYLIEGEGEAVYREFIQWRINKKDYQEASNIKGLYQKVDNKIIYGGERSLMNFDEVVFPYREDDNLKNKIVYYESSRGCPFNCKYCLSSISNGVRFLNVDRVKRELQFFIDKGVKLIKFVDRTFNCNHKFSMEIWNFLINAHADATFHFEISADILKDEEIELLKTAPKGRIQLEIGVQTTNDDILKNINRNIKFKDIKEKVLKLQKNRNIKQHLDLIAGLPGENYERFRKSFNDLYSIRPEEIQLGFLKLLKGSAMRYEAEEWGMVYSPYAPYEILKTDCLSYEEILKLKRVEAMVDKYYNSEKFGNILKYFVSKFEKPFDFYFSLGNFFKEKGYFDRNISSSDYYKVFLEYNEEELVGDNSDISEIIKFDYLKFNKKKWLPTFLNRDIDKAVEKEIRNKLKKDNIFSKEQNFHIEKFDIDILKYKVESKIDRQTKYVIFDENNVDNIFYF
ncbi:B12-binding domain-containing radical SAM protein [Clostridium pasteurianum]|uniref:Fe-S oxidoreductase n=1 Tax=Clostridium pasteurianum BC1 TaxID=86416 RepID=R4K4L6_CLOPA|nr:B12-binding domain-containing radical SAM protein [Clostridium pasteurianum]AGK98097.1 Fe-S oxidoreductase [Clostridium pasteurianum BC1]